jgi:hypothetical protein
MPAPLTQPEHNQTILVVVLFVASLCVAYWRTALRLIAIILVALAVYGVIAGLQGLHNLTR